MSTKNILASMTGFSRSQGQSGATAWVWELRSVNGRGLDIKLRLPNGLDALETHLRDHAAQTLKRGNVSGTLTFKREAASGLTADPVALERVKTLAIELADSIPGALPPRAEALLALPGVMRNLGPQDEPEEDQTALRTAITIGFEAAIADLAAARAFEGEKLGRIIQTVLAEITTLHGAATLEAAAQPALHAARLRAQLAELLTAAPALPEDRLAQEIALLATKSDVREELDRLAAHIQAATALLTEGAAIGRKLDFLMQEFNREANTLCSKSVSLPLTAIGLNLKAAIEQLREQVQNLE
ncbi:MAG: YicC family protein [Acidocella sp.]|nr:YicC family protein [Acidocella sp.]